MPDDGLPVIHSRGKLVSVLELCEITAYTPPVIYKDIDDGCPIKQKGRGQGGGVPTLLDVRDWLEWRFNKLRADARANRISSQSQQPIIGDAKQRALEATADKREAEAAKMRGDLFPIADFEGFIADEMVSFRTKLLSICEPVSRKYGQEAADFVQNLIISAVNSSINAMEGIADKVEGAE